MGHASASADLVRVDVVHYSGAVLALAEDTVPASAGPGDDLSRVLD